MPPLGETSVHFGILFISLKPKVLKWNPYDETHKGKCVFSLKTKQNKKPLNIIQRIKFWELFVFSLGVFWTLSARDYVIALSFKRRAKISLYRFHVIFFLYWHCDIDIIWPTQRNGLCPSALPPPSHVGVYTFSYIFRFSGQACGASQVVAS